MQGKDCLSLQLGLSAPQRGDPEAAPDPRAFLEPGHRSGSAQSALGTWTHHRTQGPAAHGRPRGRPAPRTRPALVQFGLACGRHCFPRARSGDPGPLGQELYPPPLRPHTQLAGMGQELRGNEKAMSATHIPTYSPQLLQRSLPRPRVPQA